jgi:hypothetical protein
MPQHNKFRHQSYPTMPVLEPDVRTLNAEFDLPDFSRLHTEFGIHHVELIHGTFAGTDPFGWIEFLTYMAEASGGPMRTAIRPMIEKLAQPTKKVTDTITADVANYSDLFCEKFRELCCDQVSVSRLTPTWSSQNHHLARAELALKLLIRLDELYSGGLTAPDERVMFWGHSHAGNGLALLSNLLANDPASVAAFFENIGDSLGEVAAKGRAILQSIAGPHPAAQSLIIVTFGAPVRYGWDSAGYRELLHVIHHKTLENEEPARTIPAIRFGCPGNTFKENLEPLTTGFKDVLLARRGDWLQLFAIAGTDLQPTLNREVNRQLGAFLEADLEEPTPQSFKDRIPVACRRWRTATRMHTDGRNLLVKFEGFHMTRFGDARQALVGHGIYTVTHWLPAQLDLVMEWLERDGLGTQP